MIAHKPPPYAPVPSAITDFVGRDFAAVLGASRVRVAGFDFAVAGDVDFARGFEGTRRAGRGLGGADFDAADFDAADFDAADFDGADFDAADFDAADFDAADFDAADFERDGDFDAADFDAADFDAADFDAADFEGEGDFDFTAEASSPSSRSHIATPSCAGSRHCRARARATQLGTPIADVRSRSIGPRCETVSATAHGDPWRPRATPDGACRSGSAYR